MGGQDSGAGQYCPISRALDVVGEQWSLLILRDMMTGTTRFNDLARGLPGLSRTLLSKRLRHLERYGVIERSGTRYVLTSSGAALEPVVFGLGVGCTVDVRGPASGGAGRAAARVVDAHPRRHLGAGR